MSDVIRLLSAIKEGQPRGWGGTVVPALSELRRLGAFKTAGEAHYQRVKPISAEGYHTLVLETVESFLLKYNPPMKDHFLPS